MIASTPFNWLRQNSLDRGGARKTARHADDGQSVAQILRLVITHGTFPSLRCCAIALALLADSVCHLCAAQLPRALVPSSAVDSARTVRKLEQVRYRKLRFSSCCNSPCA